MKKLYRDKSDCKIAGVCSGIAKYFDLDPTVIRLLWILITVFGGSGIIAYIICALIMPEEPGYTDYKDVNDDR